MDNSVRTPEWQVIATRKRKDREVKLEKYRDWRVEVPNEISDVLQHSLTKLTETERKIVQYDATALVVLMRDRVHTAVEVFTAFAKAAVAAQDLTNCLSEIFIEDGLARASELDKHLEKTGEVVGPLHGLPVSIKDHIKIKGLDSASGYVSWAYKKTADSNATVVDILQHAGAVLYVKTQNPQTLLSLETDNNIYGRSLNPFNRNLTPGGSSGGESALIACRGSCLGIGTDIGGSIRVPAAHCGLYGLKGSVARLPHAGLLGSHDGMDAIVGCVGPLASSARDLELFCRVMLDAQPWLLEAPLLEMPWKREIILPTTLSIAILYDDAVVAPHPPITDALKRYRDLLTDAGHDVIEWHPLDHQAAWDLITKLYLLDGGEEYFETLRQSGEPATKQTKWMLQHTQGRKPYTVSEIFGLNLEREALRSRALTHWNTTRTPGGRPVDAILCPAAPTLAPPHDTTAWWSYSSHWNLLDLPGVVFPVGRFSAANHPSSIWPVHKARNSVEEVIHGQWDPATYDNAPISLQLVGRRHNEEKLLAILNAVEKAGRAGTVGNSLR